LDSAEVLPQLLAVFSMLGLAPPEGLATAGLAEAWAWAIGQWRVEKIPKRLNVRVRG